MSVLDNPVELVESFTYLGCRIDACEGSEEEIPRPQKDRDCQKLYEVLYQERMALFNYTVGEDMTV